jgi:hypothetical protein
MITHSLLTLPGNKIDYHLPMVIQEYIEMWSAQPCSVRKKAPIQVRRSFGGTEEMNHVVDGVWFDRSTRFLTAMQDVRKPQTRQTQLAIPTPHWHSEFRHSLSDACAISKSCDDCVTLEEQQLFESPTTVFSWHPISTVAVDNRHPCAPVSDDAGRCGTRLLVASYDICRLSHMTVCLTRGLCIPSPAESLDTLCRMTIFTILHTLPHHGTHSVRDHGRCHDL